MHAAIRGYILIVRSPAPGHSFVLLGGGKIAVNHQVPHGECHSVGTINTEVGCVAKTNGVIAIDNHRVSKRCRPRYRSF